MSSLANMLEDLRNYSGTLNWQRGKDIERMAGGDPEKAAVLEQIMSLGEGGGHSIGGGGLAGMFAGKSARLADLSDWMGLAKAESMSKAKMPREAIWNETGWWQGPDKKWRFEISDEMATPTGTESAESIGDALSHEKLFEQYPEAKSVDFSIAPGRGSYFEGQIKVSDPSKTKSMLHELQHHIQGLEGFASGGSETTAFQNPEAFQIYKRLKKDLPGWNDNLVQKAAADEYYRRLAGEAEARLVAARRGMTPEQRMKTPPWEMYDVPESEQIVK